LNRRLGGKDNWGGIYQGFFLYEANHEGEEDRLPPSSRLRLTYAEGYFLLDLANEQLPEAHDPRGLFVGFELHGNPAAY
jgi:hypothetical protein